MGPSRKNNAVSPSALRGVLRLNEGKQKTMRFFGFFAYQPDNVRVRKQVRVNPNYVASVVKLTIEGAPEFCRYQVLMCTGEKYYSNASADDSFFDAFCSELEKRQS